MPGYDRVDEGDRADVRGVRIRGAVPEPAPPVRAGRQGHRRRGRRDRRRRRTRRPVHRRRARGGRLPARARRLERKGRRDRLLLGRPAGVRGRVQPSTSTPRSTATAGESSRHPKTSRRHGRSRPSTAPPDLRCPLLGLFGAEDANPSPEQTAQIESALHANGKTYEFHTFDDAGHAFFSRRPAELPRRRGASEGWKLIWDFFGRSSRPDSPRHCFAPNGSHLDHHSWPNRPIVGE